MRRNPARPHILFLGLVLLALLLFLIPEAQVDGMRARALSALSPLLRLVGAAGRSAQPQPALITIVPAAPPKPPPPIEICPAERDVLLAENIRLRNELERLRSALPAPSPLSAKDGHAATTRLPAGLGADVISRQILWQEPALGLNRGEADGVKLHAGVLHRGAVVGRIISVGSHASCMALLTHRGMSIAARLVDSRVEGVLQGGALPATPAGSDADKKDADGERLCRMAVIGREANAKIGEAVVTSGYDGTFPPGLWLGVVAGVKKKGDVQWEISVRPACNENAVELVHILTVALPEVPWPAMPRK